ncbi:TPA: replication initiation factor domain-containing protein [Streptococcus pneumoniae]|nr:putative phage replication protein [Streptococcus pneumoniae]
MLQASIDQVTLVYKFLSENEGVGGHTFEECCSNFISLLDEKLKLSDNLGELTIAAGRNGYSQVFLFDDNNSISYNENRADMGIQFYFSATGLDNFLSSIGITFYNFMKSLKQFSDDLKDELAGEWSISRCDVALDFIDEISSEEFNQLSEKLNQKNSSIEIKKIHPLSYNEVKNRTQKIKVISESGEAQTLYIGSRSGDIFVRFYDKKRQLIDTGKSFEEAMNFDSFYRFEVEFKLKDKEQRRELLEQIVSHDADESFVSWCYKVVTDKMRFYENGKMMRLTELMLANVGQAGTAVLKQFNALNFDYDKSKAYFLYGDSGLQSLLYKIRILEGEAEMKKFLEDIMKYQIEQYQPTEKVLTYVNKQK